MIEFREDLGEKARVVQILKTCEDAQEYYRIYERDEVELKYWNEKLEEVQEIYEKFGNIELKRIETNTYRFYDVF